MQNLVVLGLPKKLIEEKLNENVSEEDELSSIDQILQKKIQSLSGDNITKKQKEPPRITITLFSETLKM